MDSSQKSDPTQGTASSWGSPAKEGLELLEEVQRSHRDTQRAETLLVCNQAGRVGGVQPGEGSGETLEPLQIPKGAPRELERNLGDGHGVTGQGMMYSH